MLKSCNPVCLSLQRATFFPRKSFRIWTSRANESIHLFSDPKTAQQRKVQNAATGFCKRRALLLIRGAIICKFVPERHWTGWQFAMAIRSRTLQLLQNVNFSHHCNAVVLLHKYLTSALSSTTKLEPRKAAAASDRKEVNKSPFLINNCSS